MDIRIEPLDTLFFRDGKPFSMGEETWADGYLLPPPSVIYGALRTAIAVQNGIPFVKVPTELDAVKVTGTYYRIDGNTVLPLPLDLVEYEKTSEIQDAEAEEKKYEVKPLAWAPMFKMVTKAAKQEQTQYLGMAKGGETVEVFDHGFIVATELEKYLEGHLDRTLAYKMTDFVPNEPKVGNGRDDLTRSVEESLLYRTDMKRSGQLQIGVSFIAGRHTFTDALVRLGGEGKLAQITPVRIPFKLLKKNITFQKNRFKVYFSTPTLLKNGVPNLSALGIEARLVGACVGKPIHIGGFDMENKRPKAMCKAVPAGSVFLYESENDVSLLNNLQGTSLSDERKNEGFGIAYFGTWDSATI